jgi:hypothetical protein
MYAEPQEQPQEQPLKPHDPGFWDFHRSKLPTK